MLVLAAVLAPVGAAAAAPTAAVQGPRRPASLTTDALTDPIGLGPDDVQFAWHDVDPERGATQTAYRIVVDRLALGGAARGATTVWDTGRVASSDQAFVTYAGPALSPDSSYQWTVQTWASIGGPSPLAAPAHFETGLRDQDWQADWIRRAANDTVDANQYTYARKAFPLGSSPIVRARVYVSADQQYELSVNGVRAGKGEAYSYPDSQYYETLNVTRLLRAGASQRDRHPLQLGRRDQGPPGRNARRHRAAVRAPPGRQHPGDHHGRLLAGPARQLGPRAPARPGGRPGRLHREHRRVPRARSAGTAPGSTTRGWLPATVLGPAGVAPWTHLVSVRTRIVYTPVKAVSLTRLANGAVVADFGKVYAAIPTVTFHHGRRGRTVTMHAGYLLDEHPFVGVKGQVSTSRGTQHTNLSYSYVQRGGGTETFRPFDYLGFRYLQIDDPGETLSADDVVALTRHTAVPDVNAATFSSSSPTTDAVFELGRHSALFTAQEQFVDTPTREKGPWLWDGFNESQTAMAAFGEQNLTRKSLLEFAAVPGPLLVAAGRGEQDLPDRPRRARHRRVHRDLPGVGLAVLARHRGPQPPRDRVPGRREPGRLRRQRHRPLDRPGHEPARHQHVLPVPGRRPA